MVNLTVKVPSLDCQGCMNKIVRQVQMLSSIEVVATDVAAKSLTVRFDPQEVNEAQIIEAIRAIGHRPDESQIVQSY